MKAGEINLHKFLEGQKQFIVPIYQRTYSWNENHCQKLWEDIERLLNGQYQSHFLGSIVYINSDIYQISTITKLHVIDGQQRLTTISLLLQALSESIKNNSDQVKGINSRKIKNYYLLNQDEEDELRYKLVLNRNDNDTYVNILENNEIQNDYSPNIINNYYFFKNKITEYAPENLEQIFKALQKLIIVDISLDANMDNPQLIFESLNSTGLDLSQSDLIRNYLLMGLEQQHQKNLYNNYWYKMEQNFGHENYQERFDRFMRDYLTIKLNRIPRFNEIYEEFKQYYKGLENTTQEIIQDIYCHSKLYMNIAFNKENDDGLNEKFNEINILKVEVAYPFLLQVYYDYQDGNIDKKDFIEILDVVISYVFRRAICSIPTNSLNKTFSTLMNEVDKDNYVESVKAALMSKETYRRFPEDDEFYNELMNKDVYNFRNCKYLLTKLENANDFRTKEPIYMDNYTIEHIMPQNPNLPEAWIDQLGPNWKEVQNHYLHTIGNLTLTAHNPELGDSTFKEKKEVFDKSPLYLNSDLREYDAWNKDSIINRSKTLANKALEVWQYP